MLPIVPATDFRRTSSCSAGFAVKVSGSKMYLPPASVAVSSTKRPWAAGTSAVGCAAQSATAARTATSDKRFIYLCPFRRLRRREPPPQHDLAPPEYPSDVLGAYLELVRPANVATALGDVLAGFAVAGLGNPGALPWLLVSTACLYAGGVVLNDVFDRNVDAVERPERPLPSGRVAVSHASAVGAGLL